MDQPHAFWRAAGNRVKNLPRLASGGEDVPQDGFANPVMKALAGKILAELATMRGIGAKAAAVDLLLKAAAALFLMSEDMAGPRGPSPMPQLRGCRQEMSRGNRPCSFMRRCTSSPQNPA